jgi:hypothetical protein
MSDHTPDPADAAASPAGDRSDVPVPRLGTAATEKTEDSLDAERAAVGDGPDTGGLTPPDQAQ